MSCPICGTFHDTTACPFPNSNCPAERTSASVNGIPIELFGVVAAIQELTLEVRALRLALDPQRPEDFSEVGSVPPVVDLSSMGEK